MNVTPVSTSTNTGKKYMPMKLQYINPNTFVGLVGKVRKKSHLPKEEGREGGEKNRAQRAHWTRGLNPGPAAC